MSNPESPSRKKPLRWTWFVVVPAVLLTLLCIFFGPHLRRELIIQRLEAQGVDIVFDNYVTHPFQVIPGLKRYQLPVRWVRVEIQSRQQAAALPEQLQDIREIGGNLEIDLSGTDDLARDLGRLPTDRMIDVKIRDRLVSPTDLRGLFKIAELRGLSLHGCEFDNQALANIVQLKQLTSLQLDGSSITDEGLRHVEGLTNLRQITLSNTQASESAKVGLCTSLPKLELTDD